MKLSIKEVEHIAALARLELDEDEKHLYADQLSDILDYAAKLDDLDTEDIPPTARVLDTHLRLREDETRPGLTREEIFRNAPQTEDDQFKVPLVIKS